MPETQTSSVSLKRYHQAAIGFLLMNGLYLGLTFWKVPSFSFTLEAIGSIIFFIVLVGVLSIFIYRGARKFILVLAVIYAGRILFSSYTIIAGTAFPLVPYVLPTTLISFYLFGRSLWNWP